MTAANIRIGIDVGGTFTDLVAVLESGATIVAKSPSTPQDQSIGVVTGLNELARRLGLSLDDMFARTERIVHGTTVATNALLERKGAKVALLTTEGHRDVLEMREGLKDDRYALRQAPPEPLVPRERRIALKERVRADGSVAVALDDASLRSALDAVGKSGVNSVAICLLHAYRYPAHEEAVAIRLRGAYPDLVISTSSDVLPQIKEYERVSTTVVNAYVKPQVQKYLTNLQTRLAEAGFTGRLFIILSHGGMAPIEEAIRLAAGTVLSGPAGGVAASRRTAELLGIQDLVPFDMGGTSTDISLITGGQSVLSAERGLAGQRIALRSLDIASIGAGGGSIAAVDETGLLEVGPESAGADPGPACYGRGGLRPTVTDANVVLGYLDPARFMGRARPLDRDAAQRAVDLVAHRLGVPVDRAAAGIYRMINLKMAEGIRIMTLRRGVDPRRYAMLSFGGAAGVHAVEVARELELSRVIVPTVASVLSAWGMLASDLRYEVSKTHVGDHGGLTVETLQQTYRALEDHATARLRSWFAGDVRIERSAEMRYGEQVFEIDVPLDDVDWRGDNLYAEIVERFHRRHEALYTYASRDQEVILVNARVSAIGAVIQPGTATLQRSEVAPLPNRHRKIFLNGWTDVPVYDLDHLEFGHFLRGPALIESETTTVLAGRGDTVSVNEIGWLDIQLRRHDNSSFDRVSRPNWDATATASDRR